MTTDKYFKQTLSQRLRGHGLYFESIGLNAEKDDVVAAADKLDRITEQVREKPDPATIERVGRAMHNLGLMNIPSGAEEALIEAVLNTEQARTNEWMKGAQKDSTDD